MVVLLVGIVVLVVGYIFYGGWLAKQGGRPDHVTRPHDWKTGVV